MTVGYTSYESAAIGFAIAMLTGSATFQSLVGATTATAALARVVEFDGGDPKEVGSTKAIAADGSTFLITPPYAQVASQKFPADSSQALGWTKRMGEISIALVLPAMAADTPPERIRRALNTLGAIRLEIEAQFGQVGKLGSGDVSLELLPLPDDTGALRGTTAGTITISWRNT